MYPKQETVENIVLTTKPVLARLKASLEFVEKFDLGNATLEQLEELNKTGHEFEDAACEIDELMERIFKVARDGELYYDEHRAEIEESKKWEAVSEQRGQHY